MKFSVPTAIELGIFKPIQSPHKYLATYNVLSVILELIGNKKQRFMKNNINLRNRRYFFSFFQSFYTEIHRFLLYEYTYHIVSNDATIT